MMAARLLDGIVVAQQIRAELRPKVDEFVALTGRPPGLALVLAGDNPASELYVGSKMKTAGESGLRADVERLPASAAVESLLALVDRLDRSDVHDGILVESAPPVGIGVDAERPEFDAIRSAEDV